MCRTYFRKLTEQQPSSLVLNLVEVPGNLSALLAMIPRFVPSDSCGSVVLVVVVVVLVTSSPILKFVRGLEDFSRWNEGTSSSLRFFFFFVHEIPSPSVLSQVDRVGGGYVRGCMRVGEL